MLNYLFSSDVVYCADAMDANDDGTIDLSDPIASLEDRVIHRTGRLQRTQEFDPDGEAVPDHLSALQIGPARTPGLCVHGLGNECRIPCLAEVTAEMVGRTPG